MTKDKILFIGLGLITAGAIAYFIFKEEPTPPEVSATINNFAITAT